MWFSALQVVTDLKPQRGVEPVSKVPFEQEEGGCDSRTVVRVERELYGKGTLAAGVGVRVNGLESRIPEEKARQIDCEGLVSLQEEAGLVKETSDVTKSGVSELVRLDGKKFFGGGRGLEGGQGGQISKWAEQVSTDSLGGPSSTRKPSLHRAKFSFKKVGLGFSNKVGRWAVSIRPNRKKGLKKGLAQASLLGLSFFESREFKSELPKPVSAGEISEQEASPLDQGLSLLPLKS